MADLEIYELQMIEAMDKVIEHFRNNLVKIAIGRANPALLGSVRVMYYETPTPLNELASVAVPEPRQLLIKPFDATLTKDIMNAIHNSSLEISPVNEGTQIRITFPEPTTERRRELVKQFGTFTEQARIAIRAVRHDVNKAIKGDNDLTEDEQKTFLEAIQKRVDHYNRTVEELAAIKEKELMTI